MNIDITLIKIMLNKSIYNKYNKIINMDFYKQNNKELFKIFLSLFKLHAISPKELLTVEDLSLFFYTQYPLVKSDEKVLLDTVFSKVDAVVVDETLTNNYLEAHHEQTIATQVALAALDVSRGIGDMGTVRLLLDGLKTNLEGGTSDDVFVTNDLVALVAEEALEGGLLWRLEILNKTIGKLRKGNFGLFFARPEVGKTTMLASEMTFMAQQAKEKKLGPVIYFGNEEVGSSVMLRVYQAVFGVTSNDLYKDLDGYNNKFKNLVGDSFKIYDNASITKSVVEEICRKEKPSLAIFDQLDKVRWQDNERYDLKMKAIYQWARELAKVHCPVIGICQAGGTAEGKKYLDMNDVDSSHTAKQGECDWIIGIGKTNREGEEFTRYLSICKNKLGRDTFCNPDLRHAKTPVTIKADIARFEDTIRW